MTTRIVAILKDDPTTNIVVSDWHGLVQRIDVFENEQEARKHIAEYYNNYQDDDIVCVELNEAEFQLADLICDYFDDEKSANFILNCKKIDKIKINSAYHNLNILIDNNHHQGAVNLLDDFLVEQGVCQNGKFVEIWEDELKQAENTQFVFDDE